MHKEFKKLLKSAEGSSEQIISIFADIRGFSNFSQVTESPDTAMFVKRAFLNILDSYFSYAKYFKSTGDGLLIIVPFSERNLSNVCNKVIVSAQECHSNFDSICAGDPMINFSAPNKIGFGIARGTACCLRSRGKILDYSGRLLNLSSRLMNLARPSGIVIDGDFKIELLNAESRSKFENGIAYLRGIAEDEPRRVHILKGTVSLPYESQSPIRGASWGEHKWDYSLSKLRAIPSILFLDIEGSSKDAKDNFFEASSSTYVNGIPNGWRDLDPMTGNWSIVEKANKKQLSITVPAIVSKLTKAGFPEDDKVTFLYKYKK